MWIRTPIWEPVNTRFRTYSLARLSSFFIGRFIGRKLANLDHAKYGIPGGHRCQLLTAISRENEMNGAYVFENLEELVDARLRLPRPRLVLHADCTTCGSVCDVDFDADLVSQSALAHVAQTGHIVVLNGTADIPEHA